MLGSGTSTRFVAASLALLGWLGYLAFLAMTESRPTVLSRPQLLVADLVVAAEVTERTTTQVDVREVVRQPLAGSALNAGHLKVTNLSECSGWEQPGLYLVPLLRSATPDGNVTFAVPPIPRSPGFSGERPRIYHWTVEVREQFNQVERAR